MSILDKASLIQIPSGYKEDKLYSVKPRNGEGDFTFTRASTGTRVNADGYIEEVPWNILTYSEDFSQWGNFRQGAAINPTLTTNATNSPIETLTADRLQCDIVSTGSPNRVGKSLNFSSVEDAIGLSKIITLSCYVKSASGSDEDFSLLIRNAILQSGQTNLIATNEWQRFELEFETRSFDSDMQVVVGLWQHPTTTSNDIYIWGAQLVKGNAPKPYIKTTDRLDIPRLDYSGGASCPTLLLEGQRTNIVPYTEDFSQWGAINSNRTLINNTNPIDNNAYEIESSVTSSASRIYYSAIMTAGNDYSSTYLVKPSLNSPQYLGFACISNTQPDVLYDFANDQFVDFNIVGNAAKCESISMNNGWKLLKVPVHESVLNTRLNIYQGRRVGNNLYGTTGESYYIKFAQLEQGSYPTSYIPTSGTSVTRVADVCDNGGDATIFNDSEGVLFVEMASLSNVGVLIRSISLSDGSNTNQIVIRFATTANQLSAYITNGGVITASMSYTLSDALSYNKIALKYKVNDVALWVNGSEVATDTNATMPSGFDELKFSRADGVNKFEGKCKQLITFNEALTDTELEELTTI